MSEYEIVEGLDKVQELCGQMVNRMVVVQQQGRMMSLDEAHAMDKRSLELTRIVKTLSKSEMRKIKTPELKRRAQTLLDLSRNTLKLVVQSDTMAARVRRPGSVPKAASSQLKAYSEC